MQVILYYSYLCYPYNKTKCTYMIAEADSFFKEEYIEKLRDKFQKDLCFVCTSNCTVGI